MTVNQLVAFNLARARRRKGWTQEHTAEKITEITGKRWTSATLGAAERSWETGRTREFNASELVAFCVVFNLPLPAFFLPPDDVGPGATYSIGAPDDQAADYVGGLELLGMVLALKPHPEFSEAIGQALGTWDLIWEGDPLRRPSGSPLPAGAMDQLVDEVAARILDRNADDIAARLVAGLRNVLPDPLPTEKEE